MKKKIYMKPQAEVVFLRGPVVMLGGSDEVRSFSNGSDINIGDED